MGRWNYRLRASPYDFRLGGLFCFRRLSQTLKDVPPSSSPFASSVVIAVIASVVSNGSTSSGLGSIDFENCNTSEFNMIFISKRAEAAAASLPGPVAIASRALTASTTCLGEAVESRIIFPRIGGASMISICARSRLVAPLRSLLNLAADTNSTNRSFSPAARQSSALRWCRAFTCSELSVPSAYLAKFSTSSSSSSSRAAWSCRSNYLAHCDGSGVFPLWKTENSRSPLRTHQRRCEARWWAFWHMDARYSTSYPHRPQSGSSTSGRHRH